VPLAWQDCSSWRSTAAPRQGLGQSLSLKRFQVFFSLHSSPHVCVASRVIVRPMDGVGRVSTRVCDIETTPRSSLLGSSNRVAQVDHPRLAVGTPNQSKRPKTKAMHPMQAQSCRSPSRLRDAMGLRKHLCHGALTQHSNTNKKLSLRGSDVHRLGG
jgi:hypothetical protein